MLSPRGARSPQRFVQGSSRTSKRETRHTPDRWLGLIKVPPACLVLVAVVLLAGGAVLGHRRLKAATQPVKYIHVISPSNCDGLDSALPQSQQPNSSAAAVDAALPDAAAALLGSILPLTNFSALRTGQILDAAAAANVSVQQLQPLMQLHQHMWCSAKYNTQPLANVTSVKFSNVSISVYAGNDIVSNELRGKGHSWEHNEVKEMLWAVRQYWRQDEVMRHLGSRPPTQLTAVAAAAAATAAANTSAGAGRRLRHQQQPLLPLDQRQGGELGCHGRGSSRQLLASRKAGSPLMLDVGSNVGWFAINAAAAGARVAAFEAMDSNLALLRRSLCANPWLARRIALFGTGLGTEPGACHIVSGEDNRGDGIVVCGKDPQAVLKERGWNSSVYKVRGEISIKRLDDLIQEDVQVMKMDVEGFELHVLKGATSLLQRHNVWYIQLECNKGLLGSEAAQLEYFKYLDASGYSISTYGFSGPFINPDSIQDGSLRVEAWNLYCVRKDLRQAQLAAKAGVTPPKGGKAP